MSKVFKLDCFVDIPSKNMHTIGDYFLFAENSLDAQIEMREILRNCFEEKYPDARIHIKDALTIV